MNEMLCAHRKNGFISILLLFVLFNFPGCSAPTCAQEKAIGDAKFGMDKAAVEEELHLELRPLEKGELACPGFTFLSSGDKDLEAKAEQFRAIPSAVYNAFPKLFFLFFEQKLICVGMEFSEDDQANAIRILGQMKADLQKTMMLMSEKAYSSTSKGTIYTFNGARAAATIFLTLPSGAETKTNVSLEKIDKAVNEKFKARVKKLNENPL